MADSIRLKHITRTNDWKFYFYDGESDVRAGVITLPVDDETRIRRAWLMGFTLNEDGQPITIDDFSHILAQAREDSLEEQVIEQDTNSRGLASTDDRVRESKSSGVGDSDRSRSRGSVHSGTRDERQPAIEVAGSNDEVLAP